jgi:Domain of Unknown Function (DUF1080)
MKNKFIVSIAALFLLIACNNADSKSDATAAEAKPAAADTSNWITLFDGKTTTGWHSYGKATVTERWKVADGALYVDTTQKGSEGGDLCTAEEYDNFDFKLEWKIAPNGNSGIIFYVNEDTATYHNTYETGPEMQVLDNDGHPDAKIIKHRAGDLYDLISCNKETVKPAGEWNEVEIKSKDGKLDLYLNGTNVVSTTMWDDNWKAMIAASKFKSMPGFGIYKKGKIALQDHGNMVWYRNIKIRKL